MFITDTHAHLHMEPLCREADAVIRRGLSADVKRFVTIGIDLEDSRRALALAEKYDCVYATVGVHPHDASGMTFRDLGAFEELLLHKKVLAVGEVGLDYYRNHSPHEKQREVFTMMVDLALSADKPLVIHTREAASDTVKMLSELAEGHSTLLHCFSGDRELLEWGIKRENVFFSFAGNVTYPKAVEIREALELLPLDRILIETDCPYLTPTPFRGKQNEPAYVTEVAAQLAKIKNIPVERIAKESSQNFFRLFGLNNLPDFSSAK